MTKEGEKKINIVYYSSLALFKNMVTGAINGNIKLDLNSLLHINTSMQNCASSLNELVDFLYNISVKEDDILYSHCLNCGLLANVFASWSGFQEKELSDITLAGFLFDIGILLLPDTITKKSQTLSELEYLHIKHHPIKAFQFLSTMDLSDNVLRAILMHHEHCDGTGYPSKLKEAQISKFAKLIAIVDSYEAITSKRIYRPARNSFEALQVMLNEKERYDQQLLSAILSQIALIQIGKKVCLSNGETGTVIIISPYDVSKPIVKTAQNKMINLSLNRDLSITTVF